jgi:hypothetical protein
VWVDLARDILEARRRRAYDPRRFLSPYLSLGKARAVLAADDPEPAVASLRYLGRRVIRKVSGRGS